MIEEFGITSKIMVPVRSGPDHRAEMVNQMLFGETFRLKRRIGGWIETESFYDGYSGWIELNDAQGISKEKLDSIRTGTFYVTQRLTRIYSTNDQNENFLILPGSTLPEFNKKKNTFILGETTYILETNGFTEQSRDPGEAIIETAMSFLHAPYLWGGRSLFGIDCSGLSQIVFKINGLKLPRDAGKQAGEGTLVPFLKESKPGDLAFFDNEEGLITHVGILTGQGKIIHASGDVHIDSIDYQGISNGKNHEYTHKLRLIKSFL